MQVILLERVENLGRIGDVVKVKDGFARNFLLPQHKALRATEGNKQVFEAQRAQIEARNDEARTQAEAEGANLEGKVFVLIRQASDAGMLYGSVSTRDIAEMAAESGFHVARASVKLDKPLKTLGVFPVQIRLHPEVFVTVSVNIARSTDEAERQARGENVLVAEEETEEPDFDAIAAPESDETAETEAAEKAE